MKYRMVFFKIQLNLTKLPLTTFCYGQREQGFADFGRFSPTKLFYIPICKLTLFQYFRCICTLNYNLYRAK